MRPKPKKIDLNHELARRICWGRPDSPQRPFCALCQAYISEDDVPLMMFKADGSGASFCDLCVARLFVPG